MAWPVRPVLPRNGRPLEHASTEALIERVHALHREISARQRQLLQTLAGLEEREAWF